MKIFSGQLEFDHSYGACTNMADQFVYLCFNVDTSSDYKKCRKSSSPTGNYDEISLTTHDHHFTRIASSSRKIKLYFILLITCLESILALGSWLPHNKKAELLDTNRDLWQEILDYPFE